MKPKCPYGCGRIMEANEIEQRDLDITAIALNILSLNFIGSKICRVVDE